MNSNVSFLPTDDFAARLRACRKASGMTQGQLASALSVRQSAVSNWEQGTSKPDLSVLAGLSAALGISVTRLLGIPEEQSVSDNERDLLRRVRRLNGSNLRILNIMLDGMLDVQRTEEVNVSLKDFKRVLELEDRACAGPGTPMTGSRYDNRHTFIRMDSAAAKADVIIGVNGDSMEPKYHHGDRLCVTKTDRMVFGDIGVFVVNGELFVKKYTEKCLQSLNPAYPNVEIHEDDNVRCFGRVTGVLSEASCASEKEAAVLEELWADRLRK